MKFSAVVRDAHDLQQLVSAGVSEVILSWSPLSRWPTHESLPAMIELCNSARTANLRVVLLWDILMTERQFTHLLPTLEQFPWHLFDAVRCQDYGVLQFVRKKLPSMPIHWIAEVAHQNISALQTLEKELGLQLERICLNLETPVASIENYASILQTPLELLAVGPLLLFYTPRTLLSKALSDERDNIECLGNSEETPHRDFLLRQNAHGTFMYHPKDFFILDKIEDAKNAKLQWLRLDGRGLKDTPWPEQLNTVIQLQNNLAGEGLKLHYPRPVMRGYFHQNRSDKLFIHLKNDRLQTRHENMLGNIIDVIKKQSMTLLIDRQGVGLSIGDRLELTTPDGKNKTLTVSKMKNALGESIDRASTGECVVLEHVGGICVKTQVKRINALLQ
jgi:putative protease